MQDFPTDLDNSITGEVGSTFDDFDLSFHVTIPLCLTLMGNPQLPKAALRACWLCSGGLLEKLGFLVLCGALVWTVSHC
jgi:hypothetical protein